MAQGRRVIALWPAGRVACFTGHRPDKLGGYDPQHPVRARVRRAAGVAIDRAVAAGFAVFISGMALGFDQDAAEAVLARGLCLVAAVPFPGQERRWPAAAQAHYRALLARAHEVVEVSPGPYRPALMQLRNQWMADHAELVIAVWNGEENGGTANMIRYCRKISLPIWRINPKP